MSIERIARRPGKVSPISRASFNWVAATVLLFFGCIGERPLWASHVENSIADVFDDGQGNTIPYHLFLPPGYDEAQAPLPLVLRLHGGPSRGDDNLSHVSNLIYGIDSILPVTQTPRYASFVLAPQVPALLPGQPSEEQNWITQREVTLKLLADVLQRYPVDPERVYVTGRSMGGLGTYNFIMNEPQLFAAAVPGASGPRRGVIWNEELAEDVLSMKDVPLWIVHGELDSLVPVEADRAVYQGLMEAGGFPRYTEIPGGGHDGAEEYHHGRPDVIWSWMFNQTTNRDRNALTPNAIYITRDIGPGFDERGDSTRDTSESARGSVGEVDSGAANSLTRLVVKFDLPHLSRGRTLESATLRLFMEDITGNPSGPLSVFHSITDNDLDLLNSDYEDTSYEDTLLDLVQATDLEQAYYEMDVTDLVLADYATDAGTRYPETQGDTPISAFRLQVNEAIFLEDDQSARYRFTMPGSAANHPELVLTFIPEPSTSVLALLGLVSLVACGLRRGDGY